MSPSTHILFSLSSEVHCKELNYILTENETTKLKVYDFTYQFHKTITAILSFAGFLNPGIRLRKLHLKGAEHIQRSKHHLIDTDTEHSYTSISQALDIDRKLLQFLFDLDQGLLSIGVKQRNNL